MRMRTSLITLLAAGLVVATLGVGAPAQAASHDGILASRGGGSLYSGEPGDGGQAILAAAAGSSATYSIEVINAGSQLAQYDVKIAPGNAEPQIVTVTKGSTVITGLALSADGYYTAPIAPGKAEVLTVKVAVPKGTPKSTLDTNVELLALDGTHLSWSQLSTVIPGIGTSLADIYARQGNQTYVGPSQTASSPAVAKGGSVTFNIKVQNDGTTTQAVGVFIDGNQPVCGTWTIKDGSTDITSRFVNNGSTVQGYPTPTLKPGASKVLNAIYKRTSATGCGTVEYFGFSTLYGFFEAGESVSLQVPMARS